MKVFIVSSNKYASVVPINLFFLDKYWPEANVTVLGYEALHGVDGINPDQEVVVLGNQDDFGKSWSTALIPYFEKTKHESFVILVEDFILMNRVDHSRIKILQKEINSGKAQKAIIGGGLDSVNATIWEGNSNIFLFNQNIDYRCTLHPSIWKKEYFLKWLNPGDTIWDFEVKNNAYIKNDGANIIGYDEKWPECPRLYSSLNLYSGRLGLTINKDGAVLDNQPSSKFFDIEDTKMMWKWIHESKE
jgi:hypothetical protein